MTQQAEIIQQDQVTPRSVNGCRLAGDNLINQMNFFGGSNKIERSKSLDTSSYYDDDFDHNTGIYTLIEQGCWNNDEFASVQISSSGTTVSEEVDEILNSQPLQSPLTQESYIEGDIRSPTSLTPIYLSRDRVMPSMDPDAYEHLSDILSSNSLCSTSEMVPRPDSQIELQKLRTIYETEEDCIKQHVKKRNGNIFKCLFNSFKIKRLKKNPSGSSSTTDSSSNEVMMRTVEIMNSQLDDDCSIQTSIIVVDPHANVVNGMKEKTV
jgi:hypothetical protein